MDMMAAILRHLGKFNGSEDEQGQLRELMRLFSANLPVQETYP
jgi:hypothetical protein